MEQFSLIGPCIVCGNAEAPQYPFKHGSFYLCKTCVPELLKSIREKDAVVLSDKKLYKLSNNWGWALIDIQGQETVVHKYGYGSRIRLKILAASDIHWMWGRLTDVVPDSFIGSIPLSKFKLVNPTVVPVTDLPLYISAEFKSKYYDDALKGA